MSACIFILFFSLTLWSQNQSIIGRWYNFNSPTSFIQFDSLGYYNIFNNLNGFLFEPSDFKYNFKTDSDSVINLEVENFFKGIILMKHNYFILYNYKEGLGINDHIDEVGLFFKEGVQKESLNFLMEPKTFITIPEGFVGEIYIAFNQTNGNPFAIDEQGNTCIRVGESGFLETQLIENPLRFAKGNEAVKYEHSNDILPMLSNGFSRKSATFPPQTICALAKGFNQLAREKLNLILGKKVKGNIESYVIDTYENLTKFDK